MNALVSLMKCVLPEALWKTTVMLSYRSSKRSPSRRCQVSDLFGDRSTSSQGDCRPALTVPS